MNRSICLFVLVLTEILFSCQPFVNTEPQRISSVNSAFIYKRNTDGLDSVLALEAEEIEKFVRAWNSSVIKEPVKFVPKYRITLYCGDKTRDFRISGKLAKEDNDWACDMEDPDFFDELWKNSLRKSMLINKK